MKTFEQYLQKVREERRKQLFEEYKKSYCSALSYKKKMWKKHLRTDDYKEAMQALLDTDTEYQAYSSPNAVNNPALVRNYEIYKKDFILRNEANKLNQEINREAIDGWIAEYGLINAIIDAFKKKILTEKSLISREVSEIKSTVNNADLKSWVKWVLFDPEEFIGNFLCGYQPDKVLSLVLQSAVPDYAEACKNPYFTEKVLNEWSRLAVMAQVSEKLCGEEYLNLLLKNPREKNNAKYMIELINQDKIAERLSKNILNQIPDDLVELYPLARKMNRHFIIHAGGTNSGKTYSAIERFLQADTGLYLAPLRLLACEIYEKANEKGVPCSLKTGEETEEVENAKHQSSTVEMMNAISSYDVAVVDECQMISDEERGGGWTAAILGLCAKEIHLCTALHAVDLLAELITRCGDTYEIVEHKRKTELYVESFEFHFPQDVTSGDAVIVFSKKAVLHCAQELKRKGFGVSVIYGALPYHVRKNEVQRFLDQETQVVVATDAIGMGMNLPIKRIVFLELEKFDGKIKRMLKPEEIQQIAGRAGRRGIFDTGYVTSEYRRKSVKSSLDKVIPKITMARLGFPQQLIGLEGKTSTILETWMGTVNADPLFIKAEMDVPISLAKELEQISDNKELIFRFVFIPFDNNNENLKWEWKSLFRTEAKGEHKKFVVPIYNPDNLSSMEYAHAFCDMMFFYTEHFNPSDSGQLDAIKKEKNDIANSIIHYLKDHELPVRRCKYCKKILPWNYPYGMCEKCYNNMYSESFFGEKLNPNVQWDMTYPTYYN